MTDIPEGYEAVSDVPEGYEVVSAAPAQSQQSNGVVDNFLTAQTKHGSDLANLWQNTQNQNPGERALQAAGIVGDTAGDVFSAAVQAGNKVNPYMNLAKYVFQQLPNATQQAIQRPISDVADAYKQNLDAYNQANPEEGRNLQAIRSLANLLPVASPEVREAGDSALQAMVNVPTDTARGAISPIIPIIDEANKALAQRARGFDIPLSADQVAPSRVRNTIQKVSQELPFSGVDDFQNSQKSAWNTALAKTIGQNGDNLGPENIQNFLDDASTKFDSVLKDKTITATPDIANSIDNVVGLAHKNTSNDVEDIVRKQATALKDNLFAQKTEDIPDSSGLGLNFGSKVSQVPIPINGNKLSSIRSDLIKNLPKVDSRARGYVADLVDSIDELASANLSVEDVAKLSEARRQWRNFKTIEPLLQQSTDGTINPTDLLSRITANKYINASRLPIGQDDLVDLARIGKQFLPKKGGSDTVQKAVALKMAKIGATAFGSGGLGALAATNPGAAAVTAGMVGAGLGANRGMQAVNQSQALIDLALRMGKRK